MIIIRNIVRALIVILCLLPMAANSQPPCKTAKQIEALNNNQITQILRIRGNDARVFLALDPRLLSYGQVFSSLMEEKVDEIIVWELTMPMLVSAVPFRDGCAVEGYGEPDYKFKILKMNEAVTSINERGLENKSTLKIIEELGSLEGDKDENAKKLVERVKGLLKARE